MSRLSQFLIASASLALAASISLEPAQAQTGAASRPATRDDLAKYSQMGAFSSCSMAIDQKVPLEKTIGPNINMVVVVLREVHGSMISGVGDGKLSDTQLVNGVGIDTIARVKALCYQNLSASDKKFIDENLANIEKQVRSLQSK
ncbi:hypothetical protein KBY96_07395 [Cyanobium sp. ATX 6A2]|uniref:hypothetical protein n=1 Tax=Cyanobium sp. ATX 6A2 TaxID=2823700 RepID=UPI0020CF8A02|nr:hypothetical protein [Cyanobium sp. ATX 6A2]MCP9887755.1 hypothetical protein [Cyanobium sp. ATX 6A2]